MVKKILIPFVLALVVGLGFLVQNVSGEGATKTSMSTVDKMYGSKDIFVISTQNCDTNNNLACVEVISGGYTVMEVIKQKQYSERRVLKLNGWKKEVLSMKVPPYSKFAYIAKM